MPAALTVLPNKTFKFLSMLITGHFPAGFLMLCLLLAPFCDKEWALSRQISAAPAFMLHLHAQSVVVVDWVFRACFACITSSLCTSKLACLPSTSQQLLVNLTLKGAAMEQINSATL